MLPLLFESPSYTVPSLSVPIIFHFPHCFRCFWRFHHSCHSPSPPPPPSPSPSKCYHRYSKSSILYRKCTQPPPLHLGKSLPPPPQLWKVIFVWLLSLLHPLHIQNLHSRRVKAFHPTHLADPKRSVTTTLPSRGHPIMGGLVLGGLVLHSFVYYCRLT
jgi:hypothetical protein